MNKTRPKVNQVQASSPKLSDIKVKEGASLLSNIVGSAEHLNSRLRQTLYQLNSVEHALIGSPEQTCSNGSPAEDRNDRPQLECLLIEQQETASLLDNIGYVLDRIDATVRK